MNAKFAVVALVELPCAGPLVIETVGATLSITNDVVELSPFEPVATTVWTP